MLFPKGFEIAAARQTPKRCAAHNQGLKSGLHPLLEFLLTQNINLFPYFLATHHKGTNTCCLDAVCLIPWPSFCRIDLQGQLFSIALLPYQAICEHGKRHFLHPVQALWRTTRFSEKETEFEPVRTSMQQKGVESLITWTTVVECNGWEEQIEIIYSIREYPPGMLKHTTIQLVGAALIKAFEYSWDGKPNTRFN